MCVRRDRADSIPWPQQETGVGGWDSREPAAGLGRTLAVTHPRWLCMPWSWRGRAECGRAPAIPITAEESRCIKTKGGGGGGKE